MGRVRREVKVGSAAEAAHLTGLFRKL